MPQTPEDPSHSGEAAEPSGHEKARCTRKSAAHRYRWNCCSCEVLSPCADRDRSRGAEEIARPPPSYDKPSSKAAAICDETSPSYSGEIVAATYGQPWDCHPQCHDSKVPGSDDRTPSSLSVTSLIDHTFHSGKVVTKSKEWIPLNETQKLCSTHRRSSKAVTTHAIQKQWSYDEHATRSVDLPSNRLISSKHKYIPNKCIGATGKSLSQLHTDATTSSDMSHNNERESISSHTVISKGLSCSELISTKTEMHFSELALSAELTDIERNDLSHTDYNDQISSEFSASSSDLIHNRHVTKSDSSVLQSCGDSGKVCIQETTSFSKKLVICHDLQQVSDSNELPGPGNIVPCSNYSQKHTHISGTRYVVAVSEDIEPAIVLKSTEYKAVVEHVPRSSKLLTNKMLAKSSSSIVHIPEIPFEKEIVERVLSNSQITQNIRQKSKEHVATSTEEPRSENVATITDQPKSENVGTSTEQPRREHVATSTKRPKKEHVATSTEEAQSEHATSTERPRSRSVATSTDEPFCDVATSTDVTQIKHAATSIQSSFEEQITAVTYTESETQTPSEKGFRNQISRIDSNDLPYDDHALTDNSNLVLSTDMTHTEAIVTVTDKSELDEETDYTSLQELESSSDELPSTGKTSCFPF